MLKNKDIICISSIDWDFLWQGHQEIMSVLAMNGNRVLFVENTGVRAPSISDLPRLKKRFLNWRRGFNGIREEKENIYIYSPLVLPFPYSKIARKINRIIMIPTIRKWTRALKFHNPIVWSFLPTGIVLDILDDLEPDIFIYYCIDDFLSSSNGARRIRSTEDKVIERADLVFATSHKLYNRCMTLNKEAHLFPFGINADNYNKAREGSIDMPEEMRPIKRPIVGYVGGIHKWVDIELLKRIVQNRKDISFVFIGPRQTALLGLERFENVFILGEREGKELPNYIKFFDAGIIPYRKTSYTENVYPTKINEYLIMGKPVISTKIPEVIEFDREYGKDFVYFVEDERDFDNVVHNILMPGNIDMGPKRIAVANSNSWMVKIENMCNLIEEKLISLQSEVKQNWLKQLKRFYVKSSRRVIKISATMLLLWLLLFHSPFLWLLAAPLKVSQAPRSADAIIVFGGGVGEGGSPGKSTIERARFSVELYKKGFAKKIVYSSGYTYKYNDADNMRLVAMSIGVPEREIILEEEANSTYENVRYTSRILRERGFKKVLLVSSPYNMRRASLVFAHLAKDIDVIYVPVPNPQFYQRQMPVKLEQVKAVLHEYLGIIYYYFKGYI